MPLYGIHLLLLARLVHKGIPTFSSLFIAGCIFGMYEAYITKVLFDPHWGASPFQYLGVDFLWILILVFWWHALFAFIIPLVVGEMFLTRSKQVESALPGPVKKILGWKNGPTFLLSMIVIWAALFMGSNMPAFWTAPVAMVLNLIVLIFFMVLFRKKVGNRYSMRELLPDGKEFWVLFSILFAMFIVFGIIWSPERMPGATGHIIILSLYGIFFMILNMNINASKKKWIKDDLKVFWKTDIKIYATLFFIYTFIAVIMGLTGFGIFFIILSFFLGILSGLYFFVKSMITPLRK
jgi:hypothetical protein